MDFDAESVGRGKKRTDAWTPVQLRQPTYHQTRRVRRNWNWTKQNQHHKRQHLSVWTLWLCFEFIVRDSKPHQSPCSPKVEFSDGNGSAKRFRLTLTRFLWNSSRLEPVPLVWFFIGTRLNRGSELLRGANIDRNNYDFMRKICWKSSTFETFACFAILRTADIIPTFLCD